MAADDRIAASLRIGSAQLAVGDLGRSADFYERVLGLGLISRDADSAELGVDRERPALGLTRIATPTDAPPRSTGLFHLAWLHPSRAALAATVKRIVRGGWSIDGAADHGVSEALYLSDPDGLGIEIYADRPREQWTRPSSGQGVQMVTLPLDLDDLMAQAPEDPEAAMAANTSIGHVHLKVSEVPRALAFYRDALGLEEQALLPSAAFLSAGGYHHHVGLNSWQSRGGSQSPQSAPGLRLVELELGDTGALESVGRRLAATAGSVTERDASSPLELEIEPERVSVSDPDGQRLTFTARSGRGVAQTRELLG